MEPLRVTFTFTAPMMRHSEHPLHLDALVAWCVSEDAISAGSTDPWGDAGDLSYALDRAEAENGEWVWKASALVFKPLRERELTTMIRRSDVVDYAHAYASKIIESRVTPASVNTRGGHLRAYQYMMPYQWMSSATAWCIGEREVLADLLPRLPGIGKQTRNGYGQIASIDVTVDEVAQRNWMRRVMPRQLADKAPFLYVPTQFPLRAPYWKKAERVLAMEPVEQEFLMNEA